ncbi:alpha/beta hydrolase [Arthrobacter sp. KK5.5]|uniref:alpha/beta hydrolase n=1 Tax=Arthrobacter sp. KK5.5 TaxID=3373084 RepID=UPI003EE79723
MPVPTGYAELCDAAEARLDVLKGRRDSLPQRHKAAIDGVVHALRPSSMDAAIPRRRLLYLDLAGPEPLAAVAVGNLDTATHVTWQLSGAGIRATTAMWGTTREAGQLLLEQRLVGEPDPAVVAWLAYPAPGLLRAVFNRTARAAVERLAHDLRRYARLRPDAPRTAIEAHSYGATLAAHALERLAAQPDGPGTPRIRVDVLATTGSAGVPRQLALEPSLMGLAGDAVFEGVAADDWLARAGRALSGRTLVPGRGFGVDGAADLGLLPVTGHNTSRFVPGARRASHGYRDPGTQSLRNLALVTTGREPVGARPASRRLWP